MKRGGQLRIGISGWRYPGWRGKFYPKGLPQHFDNDAKVHAPFDAIQLAKRLNVEWSPTKRRI